MIKNEANRTITYDGEAVIAVLNEIELILISLHKIGAYYADKDYAGSGKQAYDGETNRFIDDWGVTQRLAYIRRILSQNFDHSPGEDDLDDLGRAAEGVKCWESPASKPRKLRRQTRLLRSPGPEDA